MWIMIVMTSYFHLGGVSGSSMTAPSITSIEFSSRERCIAAAKYTRKQEKIHNAFCVQK